MWFPSSPPTLWHLHPFSTLPTPPHSALLLDLPRTLTLLITPVSVDTLHRWNLHVLDIWHFQGYGKMCAIGTQSFLQWKTNLLIRSHWTGQDSWKLFLSAHPETCISNIQVKLAHVYMDLCSKCCRLFIMPPLFNENCCAWLKYAYFSKVL